MAIVVPAVLASSKDDLRDKLARFAAIAAIDTVQIDVIDGRFAYPPCWPYVGTGSDLEEMRKAREELPEYGRLRFDIDLMTDDPYKALPDWVAIGATRLTLHAESVQNLPRLIAYMKHQYGHAKDFMPDLISFGLAINIGSDLALIEPFIEDIDYVQCMGIAHIGKQGEPFDRRVLEKVRSLRKKYPDLVIQVDGGVSLETAKELLASGTDRLIVGSALMRSTDPEKEIKKFEELATRYGTYERA